MNILKFSNLSDLCPIIDSKPVGLHKIYYINGNIGLLYIAALMCCMQTHKSGPYPLMVRKFTVYTAAISIQGTVLLIMRGSRGGGPGSGPTPPPLRFVRGGVSCGCLMGRRGSPKVVFIFLLYIFLARFTRQYYT